MKPGDLRRWTTGPDVRVDIPFLIISISDDGKWATIMDNGETYSLGTWNIEGLSEPMEDPNGQG